MNRCRRTLVLAAVVLIGSLAPAWAGARIDAIRARGSLRCGVLARVAGFTDIAPDGHASGFEPDFCRAIAAAILGRDGRVEFVIAEHVDEFVARGDPDIVIRRLTATLRRDTSPGLMFGPVIFYDGTALLVRKDSGIRTPADLRRRRICLRAAAEAEAGLGNAFARAGIPFDAVPAPDLDGAVAQFTAGGCAALAADLSELAAVRAAQPDPRRLAILQPLLSQEPLAPLLHADDAQFAAVVRWTIDALIAAEALGIDRTAATRQDSPDPEVRRLLGIEPGNGAALGLPEHWAADAIATVGNYGEIFDRSLGRNGLGLPRGLNALWRDGGLLYPLPLR